jgi:hypothetical protein
LRRLAGQGRAGGCERLLKTGFRRFFSFYDRRGFGTFYISVIRPVIISERIGRGTV